MYIIPMNAFDKDEILTKGQEYFVPTVSHSSAQGVEIRRELLSGSRLSLQNVKSILSEYELFIVYSAPIEVWKEDGSLNKEGLHHIFQEANELGAKWLKVPLGHFHQTHSKMYRLKSFLEQWQSIHLLIENDQTAHGGNIQSLTSFFETALAQMVHVNMTFDIGNWFYVGENVQNAIDSLKDYVVYLHVKHVEKNNGKFVTLPILQTKEALWYKYVSQFPHDLPKGLEFPINPPERAREYIEFMKKVSE